MVGLVGRSSFLLDCRLGQDSRRCSVVSAGLCDSVCQTTFPKDLKVKKCLFQSPFFCVFKYKSLIL